MKGFCRKIQNTNDFHRNMQQLKKISQDIHIWLKDKFQCSVMNYVLLYFIYCKITVLEI